MAGVEESPTAYDHRELAVDPSRLSPRAAKALADYIEEAGGDGSAALALALDDAAETRRRRMIAHFAAISPVVGGDSTDIIRADRDAR